MISALAFAILAGPPEIRRGLPARTLVLTFHDIIERRDAKALWFDCTSKEFINEIDWLEGQGAHFITLRQLYLHLTTGSALPKNPVAITFADNYLGFYNRAVPILIGHQIPATMFVHTGFVGSKVGRPKMSWRQLRELTKEGLVDIESQTVTHRSVADLDDSTVLKEFVDSRTQLSKQLGKPVNYIAYPNGSLDGRTAGLARKAGYVMGFSEKLMPAERAPSIFAVPRYVHTKYRQGWRDTHR
jgi:peptidoglycan/xylan/chitin deacetylase (PgdA/CDA1 family)